jgi:cytochrome c1
MRLAVLVGVVLTIALVADPSAGQKRTFTLPLETAAYVASDLPGYQLVQRNCAGCHSAQYAAMQPPSTPRAWWDATVKKMKKPFGAPFPDEDVPAMVDYGGKTDGEDSRAQPEGIPASATSGTFTPRLLR